MILVAELFRLILLNVNLTIMMLCFIYRFEGATQAQPMVGVIP